MLESLLGSRSVEQVLFFLLVNQSCYPSQLAKQFNAALSPFQKAMDRLEQGGIVVSALQGRTRVYSFSPRYPFLAELMQFLKKAYAFLPPDVKSQCCLSARRRPRKRGKPF